MITFLSSPKPFVGHAGVIQRNAIRSWKRVHPDAEVILYGRSEGTEQVCDELGGRYVPDVDCTSSGIPFFNSIAAHARDNAAYDVQCYLNCDILLTRDILDAVQAVTLDPFLVTGQRIDLKEGIHVDVTAENWKDRLREIIQKEEFILPPPSAMDYFIFKRGMWQSLLPLVIGRGGYDSALVLYCLRNKIPFVNATLAVVALHQFHNYGHHKGGKEAVMLGDEAQANFRLHRNLHSRPNSLDAQWLIVDGRLVPNTLQKCTLRQMENFARFSLGLEKSSLFFRFLWRGAVALGLVKPHPFGIGEIFKPEKNPANYSETEKTCV